MSKEESFEEWFTENYDDKYIEDGNWHQFKLAKREIAGTAPDGDTEDMYDAIYTTSSVTWNHQQKKLDLQKTWVKHHQKSVENSLNEKNEALKKLDKANERIKELERLLEAKCLNVTFRAKQHTGEE